MTDAQVETEARSGTPWTPGPWVAENDWVYSTADSLRKDRVHGYGFGNNGFICDLNDGEYHEYADGSEQIANPRLIAAAPALYEALVGLVAAPQGALNLARTWEPALAALSLARGEQV